MQDVRPMLMSKVGYMCSITLHTLKSNVWRAISGITAKLRMQIRFELDIEIHIRVSSFGRPVLFLNHAFKRKCIRRYGFKLAL